MKALFSKKAKTTIGLDIGTKYIKAISLDITDTGTKVTGFACEPILGNAFAEREIKDFDAISKALKKVKLALKVKSKICALAVSGSSVISKLIYMEPNQTDFELEGQIELEADSLIPYPLSEVYLDFEELRPSEIHNGKVEVLLSVAHKDMVDSRITVVRETPFEPVIIDIESNALGESFMAYGPHSETGLEQADDNVVCCVNVGASLLQLTVLLNNSVIYAKEHAFGLNKLNQDLSLIYGIDLAEVESQIGSGNAPKEWFVESVPSFYANLQQQIQRALQMYVATTHKPMPNVVYICGGLANLPGAIEELEAELGLDVKCFNPVAKMTVDEAVNQDRLLEIGPQLAIAVGLAKRKREAWQK
ncbi:MAG: type IV pilus assembly protein PilM [Glaciecola sp.]